jgi:hypothetical protein
MRGQLKPAVRPRAVRVQRLIAGLDAKAYAARKKAESKLAALGPQAVPYLRRALKKKSSPETARRCRALLARVDLAGKVPQRRRTFRAVEVLERAGGDEARRQLQRLAGGDQGAELTLEARASLARLGPAR